MLALLCAQLIVLLAQYALTQHPCACQKQGVIYLGGLRRIKAACVAMNSHNIQHRET